MGVVRQAERRAQVNVISRDMHVRYRALQLVNGRQNKPSVRRIYMMAATSGEGSSDQSAAAGTTQDKWNRVKWDPFSSSDWDNERHTKEALVRIKRY